jgi:hypothetical protein
MLPSPARGHAGLTVSAGVVRALRHLADRVANGWLRKILHDRVSNSGPKSGLLQWEQLSRRGGPVVSVIDCGRRLAGRRRAGFVGVGGVGERPAGRAGRPVPGRRVGAGSLRRGGFLWGFLSTYRPGFLSGYPLDGKAPSGGLGAAGRRRWPYRCLPRLDSQRGSFSTGGDGRVGAGRRRAERLPPTGPASGSSRSTSDGGAPEPGPECLGAYPAVLGCGEPRRQPRTAAGTTELAGTDPGIESGAAARRRMAVSTGRWLPGRLWGCRPVSREVVTGRPVPGRTTYRRNRQEARQVTCVTFLDDLVILNRFRPGFFIGGFQGRLCPRVRRFFVVKRTGRLRPAVVVVVVAPSAALPVGRAGRPEPGGRPEPDERLAPSRTAVCGCPCRAAGAAPGQYEPGRPRPCGRADGAARVGGAGRVAGRGRARLRLIEGGRR